MKIRLALLASLCTLAACQSAPRTSLPPATLGAQNTQAQGITAQGTIDDSDISAGFRPQTAGRLQQEAIVRRGSELVFPTRTIKPVQRVQRAGLSVSGRLVYTDRLGAVQPGAIATASLFQGERKIASALTDSDGRWQLDAPAPGKYSVRYSFDNPRWRINNYSWQGPEADVQSATDLGETGLQPGTQNGQAAWIHDVYLKSLALFEREGVPLDWWKRQISTVWPGSGDFYTSYTVNLTGAEQWDVNGHEIGHAVYHQALNARSQGGSHKIDECYSPTLALSEGFATFFSGAVHLRKDDPDAHFDKFLVPRRAPIRIENVPEDVCKGQRNEWRVASAFWEAYDTHADGADQLSIGLKTIFGALGRRDLPTVGSTVEAYQMLIKSLPAEQHEALKAGFIQNTMEIQ